jgi:hypothetical protein
MTSLPSAQDALQPAAGSRQAASGGAASALLAAAARIDRGEALAAMDDLALAAADAPAGAERRLLEALVRRAAVAAAAKEAGADGLRAAVEAALALPAAADQYRAAQVLAEALTAVARPQLTDLALALLWPALPGLPRHVHHILLETAFLHGRPGRLLPLWRHLLAGDPGFVPDFWQFRSLARAMVEAGQGPVEAVLADLSAGCGRDELAPLWSVYTALLRQRVWPATLASADLLTDPLHRSRVAECLLGAGRSEGEIAGAAALHARLSADAGGRRLMAARQAAAEARWDDAAALAADPLPEGQTGADLLALRALAEVWTRPPGAAQATLAALRDRPGAPWFIVSRADHIAVTAACVAAGLPPPGRTAAPALARSIGRPRVQGLWVGRRLRWIERAAIRSFLANGWRYQLYAYDAPENLPDGVELLDAEAILPREALFAEGAGSGMHRGSVGAFSDLFRYALLARRGGLWADTDIINLDPFEPDGARFLSTERIDAGQIGLNGAMMAAPAGCPFQRRLLARAEALAEGPMHFTRIGPQLLAQEGVAMGVFAGGTPGYALLPVDFVNPLGWMETGRLLAPASALAERLAGARNLHVYTETWRVIGLSLSEPPAGEGFLPRLARRLEETAARPVPVRALLAEASA